MEASSEGKVVEETEKMMSEEVVGSDVAVDEKMGVRRSMNPFGVPITDVTLRQMPKYMGRQITQEDRAREAMRLIQAEDKNINALQHALDLKRSFGNGVSTLCLVYNATGGPVTLVGSQDWSGNVYKETPPSTFENGQWIAFLYGKPIAQARGTHAARVYRATNVKGQVRDFFLGWQTPWGPSYSCTAYTEVRDKDHFPNHWNYLKGLVERAKKVGRDEDAYMASTVSTGGITSPEFIAVLQHKFGPLPPR